MATTRGKSKQPETDTPRSPDPPPPPDIQTLYEDPEPYNPGLNTKATTIAFVNYVLDLYEQDGHENDDLTDAFRQDFRMFRDMDWQPLGTSKLVKIRTTLRRKGFYIPILTESDIAKNFEAAVHDKLQWPIDDPQCPADIKARHTGQLEKLERSAESPNGSFNGYAQYSHGRTPLNPPDPVPTISNKPTPMPPQQQPPQIPKFSTYPYLPQLPQLSQPLQLPQLSQPPQPLQLLQQPGRLPTASEMIDAAQMTRGSADTTIITLTKIYTEKEKYTGSSDESFLNKFSNFIELAQRAGTPSDKLGTAFPVMLRDRALDFYRQTCYNDSDIRSLANRFEAHFENTDHRLQKLQEWHSINLLDELQNDANAGKQKNQVFNDMINRLRQIQYSLHPEMRTETMLHQKILSAIRTVPECAAIASIGHVHVNQLVNSIVIALGQSLTPKVKETYFVDRRIRYPDREYDNSRSRSRGRQRGPGRNGNSYQHRPPSQKSCFICKRNGCWSTKHSKAERDAFFNRTSQRQRKEVVAYMMAQDLSEDLESISLDEEIDTEFTEYYLEAPSDENDDYADIDHSESFFTSITNQVSSNTAIQHLQYLADNSIKHLLTQASDKPFLLESYERRPISAFIARTEPHRWDSRAFRGILLDTGAEGASTVGKPQAEAYINEYGGTIDTSRAGEANVLFGLGQAISIGVLDIETPIGKATFHVVDTDPPTPFLFTIDGMDEAGIYFNNLKNEVYHQDGRKWHVARVYGHPFLSWGRASMAFLTETELRRLHRRFGHPSTDRMVRTLERAGYENDSHRTILSRVAEFCHQCQTHGRAPGRFKFALKDDPVFNHTVVADIMYLDGNSPVLQVVDEATSFQAARFLNDISAEHTWDALRLCWIDVYLGPPEVIKHDAGKNFKSATFRQSAATLGITTEAVPIEAAHSIGLVERYHIPLRRAYDIISSELNGKPVSRDIRLQMAVKAVNDTAGYDGLIPTLLVFGAFPRMSDNDPPSLSTTERATAIKRAMKEVAKRHAARQVSDALRIRNGPQKDRVRDLPIGSEVLVWRVHEKAWRGPYKLAGINDDTCLIDAGKRSHLEFRITAVKPYNRDTNADTNAASIDAMEDPKDPQPQLAIEVPPPDALGEIEIATPNILDEIEVLPRPEPPKRRRGRPRKHPLPEDPIGETFATAALATAPAASPNFIESRRKEIEGLLNAGVFSIAESVPPGIRIFGSRFVDQVKHEGTEKAFEKSRLVVQGYNDHGKREILTQAPTIQRSSQRILICAALIKPDVSVYTRDISQAYTQSATDLQREIYIRAPVEMGLPHGTTLRVNRPLYGVPEAGNHWFLTYQTHHIQKLGLTTSTYDPCLLYRKNATIGLQTDDSLIVATLDFMKTEEREIRKARFLCKPIEKLSPERPLEFNGFVIGITHRGIQITQNKQISRIRLLSSDFTREDYIKQRALGAYIATVSQPEASFALSYAAQITEPTWDDAQFLNRCLQHQISTPGLKFVRLDKDSLRLIAYTDSSFANNKDHSSQIGYVIALADKKGNANIVHWQSIKCRRVTRSVLAAELYALSLGFDNVATYRATLNQLFPNSGQGETGIPLTLCVDSKSLYDCLIKLGTTQEKRLMIDILCLRQSYERREITEILWIKGEKNPADAMTKEKPCDALRKLIATNKIDLDQLNGWVDREIGQMGKDKRYHGQSS
jgi:hypothetical protein